MSRPYYELDRRKTIVNHQKRRRILVSALIFLVLILGGVASYFWLTSNAKNTTVAIQSPNKTYYNGTPEHVIQNDQYSFKSVADWQFSPEESSLNKEVYFTQENGLIEYELDIYLNKPPNDLSVNYILPVNVSNNQMKPLTFSGRCSGNVSKSGIPPNTLSMQYLGTSYVCAVRGSGEKAAAGLVGGSYNIPLTNSNKQAVVLNFVFTNDSSSYFGQIFQEILQTFQLK